MGNLALRRVLKIILPAFAGYLAIVLIMIVENSLHKGADERSKLYLIFLFPNLLAITFIALTGLQLVLVLPLRNFYISAKPTSKRIWVAIFGSLCLIGGLIGGILFWHKEFGYHDLLAGSLISFILISTYLVINLTTINILERK